MSDTAFVGLFLVGPPALLYCAVRLMQWIWRTPRC